MYNALNADHAVLRLIAALRVDCLTVTTRTKLNIFLQSSQHKLLALSYC